MPHNTTHQHEAPSVTASASPGSMTEIAGVRVYLRRQGKGQPVLFLHSDRGGGWPELLQRLATQYDVLAPDHPGFGRSDVPPWFDNIHDLAYYYLDFLAELDLHDVHVIGAGLGGWLACEIAIRSSQRIRSLTLIGSYGLRVVGTMRPDVFLWTREETVRNLVVDQSLADAAIGQEMSDEDFDFYQKSRHAAARVGWAPRFYDPHLAKWMHRIRVPTLITWGRQDKLLPVAYVEEFKRLLPHADVQIFEHSGHIPFVEEVDGFESRLQGFFKGTRS